MATEYLVAALAIFGVNLLPAFGPPTWAVLALQVLMLSLLVALWRIDWIRILRRRAEGDTGSLAGSG